MNISISQSFQVLTEPAPTKQWRVILPVEDCEAQFFQGVVKIFHPHGEFSLTAGKFNELISSGTIIDLSVE